MINQYLIPFLFHDPFYTHFVSAPRYHCEMSEYSSESGFIISVYKIFVESSKMSKVNPHGSVEQLASCKLSTMNATVVCRFTWRTCCTDKGARDNAVRRKSKIVKLSLAKNRREYGLKSHQGKWSPRHETILLPVVSWRRIYFYKHR